MMKIIFHRYFKNTSALITSCVNNLPSPFERTPDLINLHYKGESSEFKSEVSKGQADSPLLINTVKLYHQSDYKLRAWRSRRYFHKGGN